MMAFTDGQMAYLQGQARFLLSKLKEWEKHDDQTKIGIIANEFMEICSTGYSIGRDQVCSTPWEYAVKLTEPDLMNEMSEVGWEFVAAFTEEGMGHAVWRRRKAVEAIRGRRESIDASVEKR